jgi:hypothetical protein
MSRVIRYLAPSMLLAAVLAFPALASAQGCSMCRDTAAGSAPKMRQSLRRAIPVLGIPAAMVFLAMLGVAFHFDRRTRS